MIPVLRGANIPRQQKANSFVTGSFDYESDVDAYSVYADAAGPIPTLTASGSTDVTIAYNPASPLSGYASLDIVKPSGDRQGVSIASNFRIGLGDRGSVLRFSFKYAIFSGTFPAGTSSVDSNLTAYIYDVTNAVLIPVSDHKLYSDSSSGATFNATFQTSIDSVDYKLILFIGTTDTNAWSMKVDDLVITSAQTISASIITDWQAFPSVAAGTLLTGVSGNPTYGTVIENAAMWRQVGDYMEIIWRYAQSSAASSASTGHYLFNLPAGYSIDTSKMQAGNSNLVGGCGEIGIAFVSVNYVIKGTLFAYSSTQLRATISYTGFSQGGDFWSDGIGQLSLGSCSIYLTARVPIAGWGSAITSALTGDDGRVIAAAYYQTSNAGSDSSTPIAFQAKEFDSHNIVSLSPFKVTAPISAWYRIHGKIQLSSGATTYIRLYKNGVFYKPVGWIDGYGIGEYSGTVYLVAGDYVDLRMATSVTVAGNATQANDISSTFHIEKLGGNAVALGYSPTMVAWQSYTPTFSAGLGTVTGVTFFWRRNGDSMDIMGKFTTGAVLGSVVQISLPTGYTIDTRKMVTGLIVGNWARNAAASPFFIILNSTDTTNVRVTVSSGLSEANGTSFGSSESQAIMARGIPILGW